MNQNEFGKLIKEIRKKYHLTQKDLADNNIVTSYNVPFSLNEDCK